MAEEKQQAEATVQELQAETEKPQVEATKPMDFFVKLTCIQNELSVPKNQYNNYGKYHYRSVEDIQAALKPLLKKYKVAMRITDEVIRIKERFYLRATVCLRDCESDAWAENIGYAREEDERKGMDSSQITGACSSYARNMRWAGCSSLTIFRMQMLETTRRQNAAGSKGQSIRPSHNLKLIS